MEKENDFGMKEVLDDYDIYTKLLQIGVSQLDIDYYDRDEQWKSLEYRNHQILFLREQITKMANYQL